MLHSFIMWSTVLSIIIIIIIILIIIINFELYFYSFLKKFQLLLIVTDSNRYFYDIEEYFVLAKSLVYHIN